MPLKRQGDVPSLFRALGVIAEKAKDYVIAAKGDRDKARAAALQDGWVL